MIKTWIIVLTTALPPNVDSMTQEIPVFNEESCRARAALPAVDDNGLYWSARCTFVLVPKPKEEK